MNVLDSFTACAITLHLRQDFSLGLTPPATEEIQAIKGQMQFKSAATDEDDDFMAKGGRIGTTGVLKSLQITTSSNAARVHAMSANTEQCFDALYQAFEVLYGKQSSEVDRGVEYANYDTITKVHLDAPLYGMFSDQMKEQIAQWKDLSTGMVLNVVEEGASWKQKNTGALDLSAGVFNRLYEGQQSALIMPSEIEFTISVPTNYHKLSHHKVSIYTRSVEDFQNDIYFAKSDFPYSTHLALVEKISGQG